MSDIASSLEQEFAGHSKANRDSRIAELRQIVSKGSGDVVIKAQAILMPLIFGFMGVMLVYASFDSSRTINRGVAAGVVLVAMCAWALLGPRKTLLTLTDEGVQVKGAMLPWSSIEKYHVIENSYNGVTTHTTIVFQHVAGFTPPDLGLFILFGRSGPTRSFGKKTGRYQTRLTLYVGARGMNGDQLTQRIGDFMGAAHACIELSQMNAG